MAAQTRRLSRGLAWTRCTVARSRRIHCQQFHQAVVQQVHPDLMQVQADGIRVKGCKMIVWMGWCDNGLKALVGGWGGELDASWESGRSLTAVSTRLLSTPAREAFVYRRLECGSGQYPASFSRESQRGRRT